MSDPRYIRIKSAIEKLSTEQIQKILSYNQEMVYDEFNFDETAKRYWPLAVALGVAESCDVNTMTNLRCQEKILQRGGDLNPMKGIEGSFYTVDRKTDIVIVCLEILESRIWS